jgi:hypothetical protein
MPLRELGAMMHGVAAILTDGRSSERLHRPVALMGELGRRRCQEH